MHNNLGTAPTQPYFMRLEALRVRVEGILAEHGGLTIQELCGKTTSFRVPSKRHMTAVLMKDPKKRFRCQKGKWYTR
jgi:hypothetical protein